MNHKEKNVFTPGDVAEHNVIGDLWVSFHGRVFDLSNCDDQDVLLSSGLAGKEIQLHIDPQRLVGDKIQASVPLCSEQQQSVGGDHGVAVASPVDPEPPASSSSSSSSSPSSPIIPSWWWDNDRRKRYDIGRLSVKPRPIRVCNTLTQQSIELTVPGENSVNEIQARYLKYNSNAANYVWNRYKPELDLFVPVDMSKTLEENGVPDERELFESLGLAGDFYVPVLHLYFVSDVSVSDLGDNIEDRSTSNCEK